MNAHAPLKPRPEPTPSLVLALLLLLTLTGCATTSPASLPVPLPSIPPLPAESRQLPAPAWCSPTCTEALTMRQQTSRQRLTRLVPAASPANGPTTP